MLRHVLVYKIANHLLRNLSNFSILLVAIVYWNRKKFYCEWKKQQQPKKPPWMLTISIRQHKINARYQDFICLECQESSHTSILYVWTSYTFLGLFLWIVLKHMLPWGGKWVVQWFNTSILFGRISLQKTYIFSQTRSG